MLKITRRTEYALIALHYLSHQPADATCSVSEIAARCRIPEGLLAKILQRLKRRGLLRSTQGASGGYALARDLHTVPLLDFFHFFEEQTVLVDCMGADPITCDLYDVCEIRSPIAALNEIIHRQLRQLTVADLVDPLTPLSARTGERDGEGGADRRTPTSRLTIERRADAHVMSVET